MNLKKISLKKYFTGFKKSYIPYKQIFCTTSHIGAQDGGAGGKVGTPSLTKNINLLGNFDSRVGQSSLSCENNFFLPAKKH